MRSIAAAVVALQLGCYGGLPAPPDFSALRAQRRIVVRGKASQLCAVPRPAANAVVQLLLANRVVGEVRTAVDGQFALEAEEPEPEQHQLVTPDGAPLALYSDGAQVTLTRTTNNSYQQDLVLPCAAAAQP